MKISFYNFFIFNCVYLTIANLLSITEIDKYADMISDIQGYKLNFYKNDKNKFMFKHIF